MNIADARTALAVVLSGVGTFNVRPRPLKAPRTFDGWVIVTRVVPSDFASAACTLTAVLDLGADEAKAEELFEAYIVDALTAVTKTDQFNAYDVQAVADIAQIADGGAHYVIALTLTTEVN